MGGMERRERHEMREGVGVCVWLIGVRAASG